MGAKQFSTRAAVSVSECPPLDSWTDTKTAKQYEYVAKQRELGLKTGAVNDVADRCYAVWLPALGRAFLL
jgi:hypothetical protein